MNATFRRMYTFDELLKNKNVSVFYNDNIDVLTASLRTRKYKLKDAGTYPVQTVAANINDYFKDAR